MNMQKKAIFVATRAFNLVRSRLPVMQTLKKLGWKVIAIGASQPNLDSILIREGIKFVDVPFYRYSFSIGKDLKAFYKLLVVIISFKPYFVHFFQPKPIILGGLLHNVLRNKFVSVFTVTGLGIVTHDSFKSRLFLKLYRFALRNASGVIVENNAIKNLLVNQKMISTGRIFVQISSGVNISRYKPSFKMSGDTVKILFASRLLWSKGLKEFIKAAEELKKEFVNKVEFLIAGELEEEHRDGVPKDFIYEWHNKGIIKYIGKINIEDMPDLLKDVDIIVLPSYREGMSKILMEGAAAGKPLITTNIPGCREIVHHGKNGLLVSPKDYRELANALKIFILNPSLCVKYGKYSRVLAETLFDQSLIVKNTLEIYKKIGIPL